MVSDASADIAAGRAALGAEEAPQLRLSEMVAAFEGMVKQALKAMSADQQRKWRNPKNVRSRT